MINESVLQNKLETLAAFPQIDPQVVERLGQALRAPDDWDLFRINPFFFAQQHDLSPQECLDLFIHGAKIGLFDFSYNMICPYCAGIVTTHQALGEVEAQTFHCQICNVDVPTFLDEQVEISFTIHPDVRPLDIDPLRDSRSYYRYHFSANYKKAEALDAYTREAMLGLTVLEPDESTTATLNGEPGYTCKLISIEYNSACRIFFDQEAPAGERPIEINLLTTGFGPAEIHLAPGTYPVTICNRSKNRLGFLAYHFQLEKFYQLMVSEPIEVRPYLTASQLINTQSFRDLFRTQQLPETLNLNVKSLTIMFTDLRGSTAMYDKAGDILAYQLIKKHFELLAQSVRIHSGAIVKTMGDAVMAAFVSPVKGMQCALDMLQKMEQLNDDWRVYGYEVGLKVGLHNGSVLTVVNDERLDYFGQSVNIASRIQGLAGANEIYVSDAVCKETEISRWLPPYGYQAEGRQALLRGVEQAIPVYRIYRADR